MAKRTKKVQPFNDRIAEIRKKSRVMMYPELGKLPPQATDIEDYLLGTLIRTPKMMTELPDWMCPKIMYKEENTVVLKELFEMYNGSIPIDLLTLTNSLRRAGQLEFIGGRFFLNELTQRIANAPKTNILYWCRILAEKFILRELIRISAEVSMDAYDETTDCFDLLDKAREWLEDLDFTDDKSSYFDQVYDDTMDQIEQGRDGQTPYYETGHKRYDSQLKLMDNRIVLIAALEKMGKTKWVIHKVMRYLRRYTDMAVKWHSYEVTEHDIITQMISYVTALTDDQLKSIGYTHTEDDIKVINKAREYVKGFDIEFSTVMPHVDDVCNDFKRFCKRKKGKKKVLIVDNIGGMDAEGKTRTEQDDYIAGKILALRNTTGASIILVHHLKKDAGFAGNFETGYRPLPEHIRGSGRFKDFANMVVLLNYPRQFPDIVMDEKARRPDKFDDKGVHLIEKMIIVDVARNRHGRGGLSRFMANLSITRFKEF